MQIRPFGILPDGLNTFRVGNLKAHMIKQKLLPMTTSRLSGETASAHTWRQKDLRDNMRGHGTAQFKHNYENKTDAKKLLADLLRNQARRVMADITECPPVQMPSHLARLDFLRDLIAFARNHDLISDAEKVASSFNPLNAAYTVGDFEFCLVETRKTHRAPSFLNSRDTELAQINHKLDLLAGCFAQSAALNAVLDESEVQS